MVRYHNSGTQKFDDTEHDSVSTDALLNQSGLAYGPLGNEDGNSPWTATDAGGLTVNLADTYDVWRFIIKVSPNGINGDELAYQVNGDTGNNYDFLKQDGTIRTGTSQVRLGFLNSGSDMPELYALYPVTGRWDAGYDARTHSTNPNVSNSTAVSNSAVSSPLTSIDLLVGGSTNVDFHVEAYGRDLE